MLVVVVVMVFMVVLMDRFTVPASVCALWDTGVKCGVTYKQVNLTIVIYVSPSDDGTRSVLTCLRTPRTLISRAAILVSKSKFSFWK